MRPHTWIFLKFSEHILKFMQALMIFSPRWIPYVFCLYISMRALNYPYPWECALIQRYCQHLFIIQLINSTLDGRDNWISWYSEKFVTFFLQFEHMFKLNSPAGVIYYTVIVHANWAQHLQQRSSWGENTKKNVLCISPVLSLLLRWWTCSPHDILSLFYLSTGLLV